MKLYLQNKSGQELDLTGYSPNWTISPSGIDVRQTVIDRYKQYGSTIISDQFFGSRKFSLSFNLFQKPVTSIANTDYLYYNKLNEIVFFLRNESAPFYLVDKQNASNYRRLKVSPGTIQEDYQTGLEKRFGQYTISFLSLDALWEESEVTVKNTSYATQFYTNVTLPNFCYPSYFKIAFTSDTAVTTTIQETVSGRYLTIDTGSFPSGSTIYVDSRSTGELNINGTQYNQYILNGGFFPMNNGLNTFVIYLNYITNTYLSSAPTITYRPRYPY